jgi:hypothetical protein
MFWPIWPSAERARAVAADTRVEVAATAIALNG